MFLYKKLGEKFDDEKLKEIQELQTSWLAYRDAECMWEADNSDTASLKIINELSCMARVTEDRADILSVIYSSDEAGQREYGTFPPMDECS